PVRDNGRAIPVEPPTGQRRSSVEVVMTELHAGGKFEGKGYQISGGLHGVGVSVVNALSAWLHVQVARDGSVYAASFERGRTVKALERLGPARATFPRGTGAAFLPDPQAPEEPTALGCAPIAPLLRDLSHLHTGA